MKFFLLSLLVLGVLYRCNAQQSPDSIGQAGLSSTLLELHKTPVADTFSVVQVETIDLNDRDPLGNVVVLFVKTAERTMYGAVTGLEGLAERRLKPEEYNLEFRFTGKQTFFLEKMTFTPGYRYMLKVGLADNRVEQTGRRQ